MNRLKELRQSKGIPQSDFAPMFNITQGTLSGWETGRYDISNDALVKLADFFNVSVDYLLGRPELASTNKEEYIDELTEMYNNLPEDKKEQVKAFIKFQASQK